MQQLLNRVLKWKIQRPEKFLTQISVSGHDLPIIVRENKQAKRFNLRLDAGGRRLKLTVPVGSYPCDVNHFIQNSTSWLTEQLQEARQTLCYDIDLRPDGYVLYQGVWHRIVQGGKLRGLTRVEKRGQQCCLVVYGDVEHFPRRIAEFLQKQARLNIPPLVYAMQGKIGARARAIGYKDTKSRWGSCNSAGELNFSWRIMMAPAFVVHYLVAHEVAHLRELNHSHRFWHLCQQLDPEMEKGRQWLQEKGSLLFQWDFKSFSSGN